MYDLRAEISLKMPYYCLNCDVGLRTVRINGKLGFVHGFAAFSAGSSATNGSASVGLRTQEPRGGFLRL